MIYLDNNATTQPDAQVIAAMRPYFESAWGNPSSLHAFGRNLQKDIDAARSTIAEFLGAKRPSEIVFTSGGTESDNLAIQGLCCAQPEKRHIVTVATEHSAVLKCCQALEKRGYRVDYLPVLRGGYVTVDSVAQAITEETACVSVMWANNETGVLNPIEDIARLCQDRQVPFHSDAVAAAGKVPIDVETVGLDALSIAGHKIHGPKGVGALYVRRGTPFSPCFFGGGQEYGRRSGTTNVPGVIGLATACKLAAEALHTEMPTITQCRDRLENALLEQFPKARCNGHDAPRIGNTCNISFPGVAGEGLILALCDAGIAASTGSACSAGSSAPSHVLQAMHLSPAELQGSLRLSLSRDNSPEEIERAVTIIRDVIGQRRA